MNPKIIFAALGILCGILSFVIVIHAIPFLAGAVISVGVAVILPPQ